jgi:hypothetical protein
VCTFLDYWPRVTRIPLLFVREISDGESFLYRTHEGSPVRVTKLEFFDTNAECETAIGYLEAMYS